MIAMQPLTNRLTELWPICLKSTAQHWHDEAWNAYGHIARLTEENRQLRADADH